LSKLKGNNFGVPNKYNLNPEYVNEYNPFVNLRDKFNSTVINVWHYRYMYKNIYTKQNLHRFGIIDNPNCPNCDIVEDSNHLLWECPNVIQSWENFSRVVSEIDITMQNLVLSKEQIIYGFKNGVTSKVHNCILGKIKQSIMQPGRKIVSANHIKEFYKFQHLYENKLNRKSLQSRWTNINTNLIFNQ
jgi:hypothetical protein